jgi:hypothetical protein
MNVIVPHFKTYPLLTKKVTIFTIWSKAVEMIYARKHITNSGFM